MKKKIDISELRPGMQVVELDRPWLETPFAFNHLEIKSEADIEQLRRYCKHIYIDTETSQFKLNEATAAETLPSMDSDRITLHGLDSKALEFELLKKYSAPGGVRAYNDLTSLDEEIETISAAYHEASALIGELMEDARLGKSINTAASKEYVGKMVQSVIRNPDALISFNQLKTKDRYTYEHGLRVCVLAIAFGRHLGFPEPKLEQLGLGALLLDIGKMKLPQELLNKPMLLSPEETQIMRTHVDHGLQMLQDSSLSPSALEVVANHHERYDGSGYRNGLIGDAIGEFGLISGIVDSYDAMTSDRPHQMRTCPFLVLRSIYRSRGKAFHPGLVEKFVQCIGIYPIGSVVELNTGDVGVVLSINRVHRLKPKIALALHPDNQPYPEGTVIDLVTARTAKGSSYEIANSAEAVLYGITPSTYLAVSQAG